MNIIIEIKNRKVTVSLCEGKVVLGRRMIGNEHNLAEQLLPEIAGLVEESGIKIGDVLEMRLCSDMGDNFTTHRIATTVTEAFNWNKAVDN